MYRLSPIDWLSLLLDHLHPIRVVLLVVAIGAGATLAADQVSELYVMTTSTNDSATWYGWLLAASATAGCSAWYSARNAYRLQSVLRPSLSAPAGEALRRTLPRFLGLAIPLIVAIGSMIAFARVSEQVSRSRTVWFAWSIVGLGLEAIALRFFFRYRRSFLRAAASRLGIDRAPLADPSQEPQVARVRDLGTATKIAYLASITLNIGVAIALALRPQLVDAMGPLAVLLFAGAFFSLNAGFVTLVADRRGFPILTATLGVAALFQLLELNDNHRVRLNPEMRTTSVTGPNEPAKLTFEAFRERWISERCKDFDPCPVVLVSAEGGGIRAAAWTAMVLARLDAKTGGRLSQRMFAGSGVSGGSLGLATYVASLKDRPDATRAGAMEADFERFLSTDFLSPALGNMFFVDFTQRLLFFRAFNDRGRALTRAWEVAWSPGSESVAGGNAFRSAISELYGSDRPVPGTTLPALFLNSTSVRTGTRVVQHPFASLPDIGGRAWPQVIDGAYYLPATIPLSEMVLNSARFSYVSPSGTVARRDGDRAPIQLVDGGYFENSGATTLLDVIAALRDNRSGKQLALRVLHISNDVNLEGFATVREGQPEVDDQCPGTGSGRHHLSGDATAPINALLSTREARGAYAREILDRSLADSDRLWHFRLCRSNYPIPLGWAISHAVFDEMRRQLETKVTQEMADALVSAP